MSTLFNVSFNAVLQLVIVALIGVWLAKKQILNSIARKSLAQIILWIMLPALLISSVSREADPKAIQIYFGIMIAAPIFVFLGFLTGRLLSTIFNVPGDLHRITVSATTFGNSSYIPLPFLAVICVTAPFISQSPELAKSASVTYISLYLLCYSPLLWVIGYPYLSGKGLRQIRMSQLINPPLIASLLGIVIASIPCLRNLFHGSHAPLSVVTDSLQLLAKGVFPCALLILGANLVGTRQENSSLGKGGVIPSHIPLGAYLTVILGKLLIMPIFGFAYVSLAWKYGIIPSDPLVALVLLIESSVPPANNLIIMCQTHDKGATQMARIMFAAYCVSIVTLTLATTFFLRTVNEW